MLSLAGMSAAAWWYMNSSAGDAPERQKPPVALAPSVNNHGSAWLSNIAPAQARPATAHESLASQVERFAASGNPTDAFRAYWLLHECVFLERHGAAPPWTMDSLNQEPLYKQRNPREVCAGLTERIKGSRIGYLERAAAAGVPGAMSQLIEEGPFADPSALTTRPDDPLVKEWTERINAMLRDRAAAGEKESLMALYTGMLVGEPGIVVDDQRMLTYGLALSEIFRGEGVPASVPLPFDDRVLGGIKERLTQAQIDHAERDAAAILRKLGKQSPAPRR